MRNVLERLQPSARVAIVRLRSLGDCVLTTPAISLLKRARPDLSVGVVAESAFQPLFAGNPDIDRIMSPVAQDLAAWRPTLTVNLHGGRRSAWLTLASRAKFRAGFGHFRFRSVYNVRIPRAQEILGRAHSAYRRAPCLGDVLPRRRPVRDPASEALRRALAAREALRRSAPAGLGARQDLGVR